MKASTNSRPTWAVVPVKPFALAKRRLAPVLSADERVQLARLMLQDVLAALAKCERLSGILVITRDPAADGLARNHGADVLEDRALDLNAAVRTGAAHLSSDAGMIVVPADIPLLSATLVDELTDRISHQRVVALVPATRDGGTNLLACRPAGAITPSFGPNSFWHHQQAARDAGLRTAAIASDDAGLDIDVPEDISAFLSRRSPTRSHAFLAALDIDERLRLDGGRPALRHPVKA